MTEGNDANEQHGDSGEKQPRTSENRPRVWSESRDAKVLVRNAGDNGKEVTMNFCNAEIKTSIAGAERC